MLSTDITFTPVYHYRKFVPFDGSSYYHETNSDLRMIRDLGVYKVTELYLGDELVMAFTESVNVQKAIICRTAHGFWGEPIIDGRYQELRILGTHKNVLLMCPNM